MKNEVYEWNGSDFKEGVIKGLRGEECEKHMKRLDHLSRTYFEMPRVSIMVFSDAELNAQDRAIANSRKK
jgi:hypothetical protein